MSLEDKFEEVRQLIIIGKEKGYLLYDEVNDVLPAELTSNPEDLDELFTVFGNAGIDLVDTEKGYRERDTMERGEGPAGPTEDGMELDLTPGALDKTNDPVRMYLREMGTVPLLTREGEVAIAKRIERGKLSVIKSISRMPAIIKAVIRMGDQLKAGERTVRELVIFNDEEITDDRIEQRAQQFLKQIDAVRKARVNEEKLLEKLDTVLKKDKKKYRKASWKHMRAQVEVSSPHPQDRVHRGGQAPHGGRGEGRGRGGAEGAARAGSRQPHPQPQGHHQEDAEAQGRGEEEPPQAAEGPARRGQAHERRARGEPREPAPHPRSRSCAARPRPSRPRRNWSKPTCAWSSRSPRSTPTAGCSSST